MGWGFEKKVKPVKVGLSHFGRKPGSGITFVNEKISDITWPVFVKLKKGQGVKASKINIINNSNVTALQEQ